MQWSSAISSAPDFEGAIRECLDRISADLNGERPDLLLAFAAEPFATEMERLVDLVEPLRARCVVGSSAGGVIGAGREIEHQAALSLTAAVLPGGRVDEFQIDAADAGDDLPDPSAGSDEWCEALGLEAPPREGLLILADPFTFDTERFLTGIAAAFPDVPVVGGLASGGRVPGGNRLVVQDDTRHSGAVGVSFRGNVRMDTLVAQGCRPIGVPMFVTRAERNMIQELDGRAPQDVLKDLYRELPRRDQELLQRSLFLGIVMRPALQSYSHGDFLVRNVLGFERDHGYLAVGAVVSEQQVVQFHLRDARTSHDDLKAHLGTYATQSDALPARGILLFSCLGRGELLYGTADHDSGLVREHLGAVPIGGFFCNGEIGPVQGRPFLHGYTSALGIFRPRQ